MVICIFFIKSIIFLFNSSFYSTRSEKLPCDMKILQSRVQLHNYSKVKSIYVAVNDLTGSQRGVLFIET